MRGQLRTNGIENFWSLLKRSNRGTCISVELYHFSRYLDGHAFRFQKRQDDDAGRFEQVAISIIGKRLTCRELTGMGTTPAQPGTGQARCRQAKQREAD